MCDRNLSPYRERKLHWKKVKKQKDKIKTTTTKTPALPLTKIKQDLPGSIQEKCHSEIDIVKWDSTGHSV